MHYRRFLTNDDTSEIESIRPRIPKTELMDNIITENSIKNALENFDIILPSPAKAYPSLTMGETCRESTPRHDIIELHNILRSDYPDYLPYLMQCYESSYLSVCNIFIAKRNFVNNYCSWLFDILGKLEKKIPLENYEGNHARILGYIAELLLNVYVQKNNLKPKYFLMAFVSDYLDNSGHLERSYVKKYLKKIPGLVYLVRSIRKIRQLLLKEKINTEEFSILIERTYDKRFIALFTPKHKKFLLESALSLIDIMELEAKKENLIFLPRIMLKSNAPESLRTTLRESGVRVIIQ